MLRKIVYEYCRFNLVLNDNIIKCLFKVMNKIGDQVFNNNSSLKEFLT